MGSIEVTLLLIGVFGFLIYVYLVINFNFWKKRGIIGPKPRPLFGSLPSVVTQSRNIAYDIDQIYSEYKSKERFAGIFSIRNPQLLILDPKLIQDVLVTNFKNFHDNEMGAFIDKKVDPIFGRNPFFLNGAEWKEKRSEITPALTQNRIKASYPVMREVCVKMNRYLESESLKSHPDGINAKEFASKFTIEVIANCIYGVEAGAFSTTNCEIQKMGAKIMNQSITYIIYFMVISAFPAILKVYQMALVSKDVHVFFTNLMDEAIKIRKENKSDRVDFLNYLLHLKDKKNLSHIELVAHTMSFFIDGYETSSIVISNCLHLLADNKKVQKSLREEINAAYADGEISFEKLNDLPYLDQCINETLRIYPPGLMVNKICTEACEIKTNNDKIVKIDKGTIVVLPYYSIHHDEDIYTNPEKFDPDRFSESNGGLKKYKDLGVFLAFGDGPRTCLGMKFATCQVKVAIAEIIQNWEVSLNPKTKSKYVIDPKNFLCLPDGGTWVDFKRIKH